jgi:putative ABC transport system permease protein
MSAAWRRPRAALVTGWVTLTGTGAAASVAFGLLVFASVLASLAIPRESVGLRNEALQRVIAASRPGDRTVTVTPLLVNPVDDEPVEPQAGDMAAAGSFLRSRLAAEGLPLAGSPPAWSSLTTGYVQVAGAAKAAGYGPPQFEMSYRTPLDRYSHVVAGHLPAASSTGVVQVAVTTATAARFSLRVGTRLTAGPVPLQVTGIIQPVLPASAFWSANPAAVTPALTIATLSEPSHWTGVLFIGSGALPLIEPSINPQMSATWWFPVALGRLTAGQVGGAAGGLGSLLSFQLTLIVAGTPVSTTVTSQIPAILSPFITGESAAGPALELLDVSLAVMGAVVVLLGARLVAQRRAGEFTLMRARGAALHQLGWLVLRVNVVIAAIAGAAAAALAVGLTPGDGDTVAWWLAGVTIAVTLVGPVLISVVPQRVAAPVAGRAGGAARRAGRRKLAARRIVVETALVAVAVGGLVALRNEGLTPGSNGLYTSAVPVLVAIPVAVVVLRCYPPLARELARIAGLSRGVVAFVGLARATRTPPGTVLPSFALVLVLAMVAFPAMIRTSVTSSQVAASWQQVGTDAIIQAPPGQVITPALQRQISSVPGVVSAAPAVVDAGTLPSGSELAVVFVDPARYAAVIDQAPGPPFPLGALSGNAGSSQAAATIPAVANAAAAAQLAGHAPASVSVGTAAITIRLAGRIGGVPGASAVSGAAGGGVVVLPLRALGPRPPGPDLMLVAGPGLDGARLTAAVRRALPGGLVTLRATALDALTTAPVLQAAQTALTQGLATAAGFGVLVLLLSLLISARTRDMTLARLATMGLRRWQAQLLLAAETLPPVVAAAVGGIACAWLLAPLVGPSLNLAALSGTGSVIVTPAVFPLVASAAGLVLAALLVLAAQAVITYYRGSARALRIAD